MKYEVYIKSNNVKSTTKKLIWQEGKLAHKHNCAYSMYVIRIQDIRIDIG